MHHGKSRGHEKHVKHVKTRKFTKVGVWGEFTKVGGNKKFSEIGENVAVLWKIGGIQNSESMTKKMSSEMLADETYIFWKKFKKISDCEIF